MSRAVQWILTDPKNGDVRVPVVDIDYIYKNVPIDAPDEYFVAANRIAQAGVIKREHLTHDIMDIVGVFDNENIPNPADYPDESRYFNTDTKKLYIRWHKKQGGISTPVWMQPVKPDNERMFVSLNNGKLYRYFSDDPTDENDGELTEVGGEDDMEFVEDDHQ